MARKEYSGSAPGTGPVTAARIPALAAGGGTSRRRPPSLQRGAHGRPDLHAGQTCGRAFPGSSGEPDFRSATNRLPKSPGQPRIHACSRQGKRSGAQAPRGWQGGNDRETASGSGGAPDDCDGPAIASEGVRAQSRLAVSAARNRTGRHSGGSGEIRTHERLPVAGFQDRCNRPLCHASGKSGSPGAIGSPLAQAARARPLQVSLPVGVRSRPATRPT